jgi:hypothetical protein
VIKLLNLVSIYRKYLLRISKYYVISSFSKITRFSIMAAAPMDVEHPQLLFTANQAREFLPPFMERNEFMNRHIDNGFHQDELSIMHLHYLIIYGKWNDFIFYATDYLSVFQQPEERTTFINTTFDWLHHDGNLFFTCALWNAPREVVDFIHNEGADISMQNVYDDFPEEVIDTQPFYQFQFEHIQPQHFLCDNNNIPFRRDTNSFEDIRHYISALSGEEPL